MFVGFGGANVVHCSYHKCLTSYYDNVAGDLFNRFMPWSRGYRHFNSRIDRFHDELDGLSVASVNNHAPELDRLGDFRLTRFVRDPRDLVVSGYFYHRRGAEPWCRISDPRDEDWRVVNGCVPDGLASGQSYADFLQERSREEGLLAEIEFRRYHFQSMRAWPASHPDIRLFRYEDIMGDERRVFEQAYRFYGASWITVKAAGRLALRYSADRRAGETDHIRNPRPEQWREVFTPRVLERFNDRYGDLVERLGYRPGRPGDLG